MKVLGLTAAFSMVLAAWVGSAQADTSKDDSGRGRERGGYSRYDRGGLDFDREPRRSRRSAAVQIPHGHLPPPGECRIWNPRLPAGHQSPPYRC